MLSAGGPHAAPHGAHACGQHLSGPRRSPGCRRRPLTLAPGWEFILGKRLFMLRRWGGKVVGFLFFKKKSNHKWPSKSPGDASLPSDPAFGTWGSLGEPPLCPTALQGKDPPCSPGVLSPRPLPTLGGMSPTGPLAMASPSQPLGHRRTR